MSERELILTAWRRLTDAEYPLRVAVADESMALSLEQVREMNRNLDSAGCAIQEPENHLRGVPAPKIGP